MCWRVGSRRQNLPILDSGTSSVGQGIRAVEFVSTTFSIFGSTRTFVTLSLGCVISLGALSYGVWYQGGWPSRWDVPPTILSTASDPKAARQQSVDFAKNRRELSSVPFRSTANEKVKLLIIGDSHARDMFNALPINKELFDYLEVRLKRLRSECMYLFADDPSADVILESMV